MCGQDGNCGSGSSSSTPSYPLRAPVPVGKRANKLYRDRTANFYSPGQWEKVNLLSMMHLAVRSDPSVINLSVWHSPGLSRPTFADATASANDYRPSQVGDSFGPSWSTHWFRVRVTIPEEMQQMEHLELHWDCSNEATVWTAEGQPLQGLTGRGERIEWILPASFKDGREHVFFLEMACNGMLTNAAGEPIFKNNANGDAIQPPDPNKSFSLTKAEIVAVDRQARALHADITVIHQAAEEFPEDSWEQHEALNVATRIINAFRVGDRESIVKSRKIAEEYLGPNVNSANVFNGGGDKGSSVLAIGHCHIDTCWLWPWEETKRKVARSWLNQCDLMDRYPELNFACSQAQQFKWLKQGYPYAWERVQAKVEAGQFHPIGGCWVEHDTNIPSGESLIRQFLFGQRFFESNFGRRSTTCWLPDTFGQSSQMPQLCRQAGMNRFLTQKICFNNMNEFPHTTFNWVALDGSQVICHMPPAKTYCANATFGDVKRSMTQHKSLDQDHTSLLVLGKGDGGGGPTWQQLESLRRLRGLSDTTGLLPRVHSGGNPDDFFDRLEKKAQTLPTWHGELYFELHRGVYTTQAQTKLNNRKAEILLRDVELLATIASVEEKSYRYPKRELDEMWEGVLLCQFHDCLPGTAIGMCYDDSDKVYANVYDIGNTLLRSIYSVLKVNDTNDKPAETNKLVALNTLGWPRKEVVTDEDGKDIIAQGTGNIISAQEVTHTDTKHLVTVKEVSTGIFVLENSRFTVTVDKGCITSLYDRRAKREAIAPGSKANQYVIFDDKPIYWQAWDVEVFHLDTREELQGSQTYALGSSPLRASVVTETRISDVSSIRTTVSLAAAFDGDESGTGVECTAEVDWHETMKFLKVEFPVDVRHHEASYDTQFGVIRRPTHYNTSWDMAKFEVCCHKYADLSEYGYGVSILNDSKYGFATVGNTMRLSLLRSSKAPDDGADMGKHVIRWSILPHRGPLGPETVRAAFEFNNPLKLVSASADCPLLTTGAGAGTFPVALTGDENLVLDTIKRGEDDEDVGLGELPVRRGRSVVVRVYESLGGRGRGKVVTRWEVRSVHKTNLLEDDEEEVRVDDGGFEVDLGPFQLQTYRLELVD
ncbi:glycosyl hydrolase family 38 domain-containing protein [Colletotrichum orchidophilum]|uniref:Alpha-mannosidase n=1 Tax=Colletotrichum orchidophilum TaxID=1209926 RepID=A0A1G4AP64_9PEZI|nr:glycosyl hydrolase family 38 domain-containing protein [Colletotrichum orchidophilum]OHE90901.1 glycosyl hydrolase family 38 domain-containing protein [Colletotrichum orchidophilum]